MWCGLSSCVRLAGAIWEFTNAHDCNLMDIEQIDNVSTGYHGQAIEDRERCAARCLEKENCVSFNFPLPSKGATFTCFLKHTHQHSLMLNKRCASHSGDYEFYSLIGRNHDVQTQQVPSLMWKSADEKGDNIALQSECC
jgi:hypothetical protein